MDITLLIQLKQISGAKPGFILAQGRFLGIRVL